jgi:hypothetical protein
VNPKTAFKANPKTVSADEFCQTKIFRCRYRS